MEMIIDRYLDIKHRVYLATRDRKHQTRQTNDCQLMVVTKQRTIDEIIPLLQQGHRLFGENRVQEAQEKWPQLKQQFPDLQLHLIGPLQTNKTKESLALFDHIQTIDRDRLAEQMTTLSAQFPCWLEINIGNETQKAGIPLDQFANFYHKWSDQLNIQGLMCIPPALHEPAPYFALMQKLAWHYQLPGLSMGMSNDFETAICFGATIIRVGSAIFEPK